MQKHKLVFRLTGAIAALLILIIGYKQVSGDDDIIVDLGAINRASWSSNSLSFVTLDRTGIDDVAVDLPIPNWLEYKPSTQSLSASRRWPLQPLLTEQEQALFQPEGFIYASPDGRFLLYSKRAGDNNYYLTIGDRVMLREANTNIQEYPLLAPVNDLPVLWSENNRTVGLSFPVGEEAPGDVVFTLSLHLTDNDFQVTVNWFGNIVIDDKEWNTLDGTQDYMYDISDDGTSVLLSARNDLLMSKGHFIIWTPDNPDTSRVIAELDPRYVTAIAFGPGNNNLLLLVDSQGNLQTYDLSTGQLKTLRSGISDPHVGAWFSPNGQWLAIYTENNKLSFVDLQSLLSHPSPTLADVLSDISCSAACFLGIEPGITTKSELEAILKARNLLFAQADTAEGHLIFYSITAGQSTSPLIPDDAPIYIDVTADTVDLITIFLQDVTASQIVSWFGTPDVIGGNPTRGNSIFYVDRGLEFVTDSDDSELVSIAFIMRPGRNALMMSGELSDVAGKLCRGSSAVCAIPTATPSPTNMPAP